MNTYSTSVVDVSQYLDLATTRKERKMSFTNGIASLNLPLIAPVETGSHDSDIDEADVMSVLPVERDRISDPSDDGNKDIILDHHNGESITTIKESVTTVSIIYHEPMPHIKGVHLSSDRRVTSQSIISSETVQDRLEIGNGSEKAELVGACAPSKNAGLETRVVPQVHSAIDRATSQGSTNPEPSASPVSDTNDSTTDDDELAVPEETKTPVTPQVQRGVEGPSTKTPTFANGTLSDVKKPRNGRNSRRRADTPHPGATSSSGDSTATTPQTTPDKSAKAPRKRRYSRKSKAETSVNDPSSSSHDSGTKIDEFESPLARKSTQRTKPRSPSENVTNSEDSKEVEVKDVTHRETSTQVPSKETPSTPAAGPPLDKPSSPADALALEIDYPSFQTTEILEFETYCSPTTAPQVNDDPSVEIHLTAVNKEEAKIDEAQVEDKEPPKPTRTRKPYIFTRRFRGPRIPPKRPDLKPAAEEGLRPALAILFEQYGARFRSDRRPHLQFGALQHEAQIKYPDLDLYHLRGEFNHAFEQDCEREWPAHEIMMSPIDQYFAKCEAKVEKFHYDPKAEASAEFERLALVAGWIDEIMRWDIDNWEDSMARFEELWSSKVARAERKKFKYACFAELDRSVGHIFFGSPGRPSTSQNTDGTSDPDTAPSGQHWDLDDYHHFLDCFDEPHLDTTEACREHIGEKLNINLYDLLDWLRNPSTTARPDKFQSIKDLAHYSYLQNKVFPILYAAASKIANPLLRPIGKFAQRSIVKGRNSRYRQWHSTPADGARPSNSNAKAEKDKKRPAEGTKGKESMASATTEPVDVAASAETASVNKMGTGASLFNVLDSTSQGPGLKSHRVPMKTRRASVISERPSEKVIFQPAGQVLAAVA